MSDNTSSRNLGKVKWFNNKAGYGFITAVEGDLKDKDIFVHYSTINVANPQYKYLVQGEYVEFELVKSQSDKHEYQATNVSGVKGGSIMCETRQTSRPADLEEGARPRPARRPRQYSRPSQNRRRPADSENKSENVDNEGFITVEQKKRSYRKPAPKEAQA
jgi:CspA family cold shock protein